MDGWSNVILDITPALIRAQLGIRIHVENILHIYKIFYIFFYSGFLLQSGVRFLTEFIVYVRNLCVPYKINHHTNVGH